jgi:hypothetical protein
VSGFHEIVVTDWSELIALRGDFDEAWLFRGQPDAWPLVTSLERACASFDVQRDAIPAVEEQMIREFRRRYTGRHRRLIFDDTLFCMALMQHHGAPTRLLDFSYSFHVAAFFAIEPLGDAPTIWCVNGRWCREQVVRIAGVELVRERERDRDESTFRALYMREPPFRLVFPENPFPLHRRLIIQQGVFGCPADVASPFLENLAMGGGDGRRHNLVKLRLELDSAARRVALTELARMNIDRATLFPGLDGFAQSLTMRIPLYQQIASAWAEEAGDEERLGPPAS